jgi:hypothetical protein
LLTFLYSLAVFSIVAFIAFTSAIIINSIPYYFPIVIASPLIKSIVAGNFDFTILTFISILTMAMAIMF